MKFFRLYGLTILIASLVAVYTMTSSGKYHIIDEVSLFAVTESLSMRGEMDTNAIAWSQWVNSPGEVLGAFSEDGEVYSKKGPAPAFLAVPWHMLLRLFGLAGFTVGLLQGALLWNGLVTAFTAGLLWMIASRLGYRERTGMALGLLFGLTTIAWPYANHFFGEPMSAFSLLLAFYGITAWHRSRRTVWMLVAGIGAGIAVAAVTAHAVLIGLLAAYALGGWWLAPDDGDGDRPEPSKSINGLILGLVAFVLPILVAGGLLLWYNQARFGSPFDTGYHFDAGEGFTTPIWTGFWGLVASPYRGLFWHTPLFFVSLFAFVPFVRRHRLEGFVIGAMSVVLIGLYSMWWMWWGGFAWGPRFLVPLTPFWVLVLAPWVERTIYLPAAESRRSFRPASRAWIRSLGVSGIALVLLALVSLIVQVAAVTVNYVNYEIELRSIFPTDWDAPLAFGPPAQAIGDLLHSPVFGQFKLIFDNLVINSDLAWLWASGNVQWMVVLFGGTVMLTLAGALVFWWRDSGNDTAPTPGWPLWALLVVLPLVLIAVWTGNVSRNPHYGDPERGYRAVLDEICAQATDNEAVVTIAPFSYQIPMNWLGATCRQSLPIYGYATTSLDHPEAQAVMERLREKHDRIWLVTAGLPVSDPDNTIERWLADVGYKADDTWYEDYRLVRYGTPQFVEETPTIALNLPMRGKREMTVTVLDVRAPEVVAAGEILPVDIFYELATPIDSDFRWFVQLIDPGGYATALLDTAPMDGYARFTELPVGERQLERAGLQIPANAGDGVYQLIAGLYDPNTEDAPRLIAPDGSDFVELGKVTVEGADTP